jgi:hypothetical protein
MEAGKAFGKRGGFYAVCASLKLSASLLQLTMSCVTHCYAVSRHNFSGPHGTGHQSWARLSYLSPGILDPHHREGAF